MGMKGIASVAYKKVRRVKHTIILACYLLSVVIRKSQILYVNYEDKLLKN